MYIVYVAGCILYTQMQPQPLLKFMTQNWQKHEYIINLVDLLLNASASAVVSTLCTWVRARSLAVLCVRLANFKFKFVIWFQS